MIVWNRRSGAPSFSMYLRYSSSIMAPMHCTSPRARAGLRTFEASIAPLGPAGADEGVQFVNEEDRVLGTTDLVHHRLDPLLELAAILGAGDHHGQIQDHDPAVAQLFGDVAVDDHPGPALDDRRLAGARLAGPAGLFLVPAQHLDHALDFIFAADYRVQLALPRQLGQVASKESKAGVLDLLPFDVAPRSLSPPASIP